MYFEFHQNLDLVILFENILHTLKIFYIDTGILLEYATKIKLNNMPINEKHLGLYSK